MGWIKGLAAGWRLSCRVTSILWDARMDTWDLVGVLYRPGNCPVAYSLIIRHDLLIGRISNEQETDK
jgi:hypothetical protein